MGDTSSPRPTRKFVWAQMGIADLHLLILLPIVTVAELAVNEAPSEWNEGECVETRKARLSSKASSAALASDYHNGRGTRDDRRPRAADRANLLAKSVGEGMGEAEGQPGWRHLQGQPSDGRRVRTARTKAADKKSWKVPPLLPARPIFVPRQICHLHKFISFESAAEEEPETGGRDPLSLTLRVWVGPSFCGVCRPPPVVPRVH